MLTNEEFAQGEASPDAKRQRLPVGFDTASSSGPKDDAWPAPTAWTEERGEDPPQKRGDAIIAHTTGRQTQLHTVLFGDITKCNGARVAMLGMFNAEMCQACPVSQGNLY